MEDLLPALPKELLEKIAHARRLSDRPLAQRFVEPATVAETLHERVETQPHEPYLTYLAEDGAVRSYTYAQFYSRVKRLAAMLNVFVGVNRGDRIATAMHNHDDGIALCFAAWHLGVCVVPLNMSEEDKRLQYVLEHSGVKAVFVLKDYSARVRPLVNEIEAIQFLIHVDGTSENLNTNAVCATIGSGTAGGLPTSAVVEALLETVLPQIDVPQYDQPEGVLPDDEALIVYTSGTTGVPKGVVLSQYALVADAYAITHWFGLSSSTRMMCVLPVHHVNGLEVTHVTPMFCGGSVLLNRKFSASGFFSTIEKYKIEIVSVVPTLLQFLLETHAQNPTLPQVPSLRYLICGAGPLTVDLAARFEDRFHIPICHGYGLSETTCYSCFVPPPPVAHGGMAEWQEQHKSWMRGHGYPSIGVPVETNEMTIHDDHGQEVAEGVKGEIVIRGHNLLLGYYLYPTANENAFTYGWFRSGDEGFFKYDSSENSEKSNEPRTKYFFISGRFKELIIRGGVKISPLEVDEALQRIPGVKAGIAVGFAHTTYGEEVGAYVVKQPDAKLTEEDVLAAAKKLLPAWMCPKVVVFGETVPVTSTGKYQRNPLKPLFDQRKDV